jgi:hypothetical protein
MINLEKPLDDLKSNKIEPMSKVTDRNHGL